MQSMRFMNSRVYSIGKAVCLLVALFCLFRGVTARAAATEEEEVYSNSESETSNASEDSDEVGNRAADIRLSRASEAESRIAYDQGFPQVKGIDRLREIEKQRGNGTLQIPVRTRRSLASVPQTAPAGLESDLQAQPMGPSSVPQQPHSTAASEPSLTTTAPMPTQAIPNPVASAAAPQVVEAVVPPAQANVWKAPADGDWKPKQNYQFDRNMTAQKPQGMIKKEPGFFPDLTNPLSAAASSKPGLQEVSVIVSESGFYPKRIFVTQNVPVKLYLSTAGAHTMCFMVDNLGIKKGVAPGKIEELSFTPEKSGDFRFYCPIRSLEGTLTVKEVPVVSEVRRAVSSVTTEEAQLQDPFNEE